MEDKELITAESELEVTKFSTCTSLADDNSPMALEPEAENEVSLPAVKKAKGLGAILFKLPTVKVSTEVSTAEKLKRKVGSYLDLDFLIVHVLLLLLYYHYYFHKERQNIIFYVQVIQYSTSSGCVII